MGVIGVHGVALEVPDLAAGRKFYEDAGLEVRETAGRLHCRCFGKERDVIVLIPGAARKRLHHLSLAADPARFAEMRQAIGAHGGELIEAPDGFDSAGIWLRDPHGMIIHLLDSPADIVAPPIKPFVINQPGYRVRTNRGAIPPKADMAPVRPLRLGHVLVFTPDIQASIAFFEKALGMGIADRGGEAVAFMCTRYGSDHHVVAFAQSHGVGFHHASLEVATPDEVGIAGARLRDLSRRGTWGFGRHTIGSNFFHYLQDPWGSWFEYFSDMDYVADYSTWTPSVYAMEDALHHWGPEVPPDFVHNYEADENAFEAAR